jgi:hypothetical protein
MGFLGAAFAAAKSDTIVAVAVAVEVITMFKDEFPNGHFVHTHRLALAMEDGILRRSTQCSLAWVNTATIVVLDTASTRILSIAFDFPSSTIETA